jgi:hypothetical protein
VLEKQPERATSSKLDGAGAHDRPRRRLSSERAAPITILGRERAAKLRG